MTTASFSPALAINDVLRTTPMAAGLFKRLGIDTCCGGSRSLAEAAASIGMPLPQLLAATAVAVPGFVIGREGERLVPADEVVAVTAGEPHAVCADREEPVSAALLAPPPAGR